jgi:hypothetical protein
MKRLRWMAVVAWAWALFGVPGPVNGQGVNYQVSLSASLDKIGNFVEATATASGPGNPWVEIAAELSGGGHYDASNTQGWYYAHAFLYAFAESDEYYTLTVAACADWYDGWWDCDFKFEDYYSPAFTPILSSIDPSSGNRGECYTLQLYGENLAGGSVGTDSLYLSIDNGQTAAYHNQVTTSLCVSGEAPAGGHSIWVSTGAGTSSAKQFTVNQ